MLITPTYTTYVRYALVIIGIICIGVALLPRILVETNTYTPFPITEELQSAFDAAQTTNTLPIAGDASSSLAYRVVIPKIGVDMPISFAENADAGMLEGAWHIPGSGMPDQGESSYKNIVLTGHRYLYTSGPQTFFHMDDVNSGDIIDLVWEGETHRYLVYDTFIVEPNNVDILRNTDDETLTIFTCNPVFSTKERLVVRAKPIE